MKKWTIKTILRNVWVSGGLLFTAWLIYSFQSKGVDDFLLESGPIVKVEHNAHFYAFEPSGEYQKILIFYPGALVDPLAYVPLCRRLADHGIKVVLIKMPWRLASLGYNAPKSLLLFSDTTKQYILAGHSQGAKMAAQFVFENPGLVNQLILIGSTHPRDFSLAQLNIPVMKIYGSNDGVADEQSIMANRSKLPGATEFVRIEGGNHAQFGYYGLQLGDYAAAISREQQQAITLEYMLNFINKY